MVDLGAPCPAAAEFHDVLAALDVGTGMQDGLPVVACNARLGERFDALMRCGAGRSGRRLVAATEEAAVREAAPAA
jgi:hypothetical protein